MARWPTGHRPTGSASNRGSTLNFSFESHVGSELFARTKAEWQGQLDANPENTSATYYEAGLDFLERTVDGKTMTGDGGGCVCAISENGNSYASALIVVSHARAKTPAAFLKMLNVYVQPNLNLADSNPNMAELAWITATAITGCLGLTYEAFPSEQLKIHAAFPLDQQFLASVTTLMLREKDFSANFIVSINGTWLVVTKKGTED